MLYLCQRSWTSWCDVRRQKIHCDLPLLFGRRKSYFTGYSEFVFHYPSSPTAVGDSLISSVTFRTEFRVLSACLALRIDWIFARLDQFATPSPCPVESFMQLGNCRLCLQINIDPDEHTRQEYIVLSLGSNYKLWRSF